MGGSKQAGPRGSGDRGRSRRPQRLTYRRVLVVTEGSVTEPQYIEGLVQRMRSAGIAVSVTNAHGASDPVSVVEKCISRRDEDKKRNREPFDHFVCLVDVDTHAHLREAISVAEEQDVQLIVTNLKFEVWLFWHIGDSLGVKTSKELDDLMKKHELFQKPKHLSPNFPFENVDRAITNAYRADPDLAANRQGPDPSSAMPVLVGVLRGS